MQKTEEPKGATAKEELPLPAGGNRLRGELVQPAGMTENPSPAIGVEPRVKPEEQPEGKPDQEIVDEFDYEEEDFKDYRLKIIYRRFDSEDAIRLRGSAVLGEIDPQKKTAKVDMGMMQKISIICGIRSCPWFTDRVDQRFGVTENIYNNRMENEFRNIPVEFLENLFTEVRKRNKAQYEKKDLKKN